MNGLYMFSPPPSALNSAAGQTTTARLSHGGLLGLTDETEDLFSTERCEGVERGVGRGPGSGGGGARSGGPGLAGGGAEAGLEAVVVVDVLAEEDDDAAV